MSVAFAVFGTPVPQGSMRAWLAGGRPILTYGNRSQLGEWRQLVSAAAIAAMGERPAYTVAMVVDLELVLARPRGHFGKAGIAPRFASARPISRPDLDKLVRSTVDAMVPVVLADDALVVELHASKRYAVPGEPTGCLVNIYPSTSPMPELREAISRNDATARRREAAR